MWSFTGDTNDAGVMRLPFKGQKDGRLRLRLIS